MNIFTPTRIWFNQLLYGLLPGQCILCKGRSHRQLDLCQPCEDSLPGIQHGCWQCGLELEAGTEICSECIDSPPPFDHCFARFKYEAPIDLLINQFKNRQRVIVGKVLSSVLASSYLADHLVLPDAWIPVPLHKNRLKARGFNQAIEIAEVLSDLTGIPSRPDVVRRIRETNSQRTLGAKARQGNVLGAFSVDTELTNMRVAIVDDVVTTGATVAELSRHLLDKGAFEVQVVCLARTLK